MSTPAPTNQLKNEKRARFFLPPAFATLIILLLCGIPGNQFPRFNLWLLLEFDKLAHIGMFAVYGWLWSIALARYTGRPRPAMLQGLAISALFGVFVEVMQWLIFVRRSAEWADIIADAIGALAGAALFYLVYSPVWKPRAAKLS